MRTVPFRIAVVAAGAALAAALLVAPPLRAASLPISTTQDLTSGSWLLHAGDDARWASRSYDDTGWHGAAAGTGWETQGLDGYYGYAWYRLHFVPEAAVAAGPYLQLSLNLSDEGAWAYLNGRFVGSSFRSGTYDIPRELLLQGTNVLAVRVLCNAWVGTTGYDSCGLTGSVQLQASSTAASGMPVQLSTGTTGNLASPGSAVTLTARVINSTTSQDDVSVAFAVTNQAGTTVMSRTLAASLGSGQTGYLSTPFSSEVRGPYTLTATLSDASGTLSSHTLGIGVADPPGPPDPRFGGNINKPYEVEAAIGSTAMADLALSRRAGARFVRETLLPWAFVQPYPGSWQWGYYDAIYAAARRMGLTVLWDILGVPYWSQDGMTVPNVPSNELAGLQYPPSADHFADMARFLAAAAARYPHSYWEIWNEEDGNPPHFTIMSNGADNAAAYLDLLRDSYTAIKAVDPTATVVLGGLQTPECQQGPWDTPYGNTFFDRLMAAGPLQRPVELANFHAYDGNAQCPGTIYSQVLQVRQIMEQYGIGSKPLWITETNYNTPDTADSQYAALRNLVQAIAAGVQQVDWFTVVDDADDASLPWGLFDQAGEPRPAFFAYLATTHMLAGSKVAEPVTVGGIPGFAFSGGALGRVTALWDDTPTLIRVPAGANVYDAFGNPVKASATVTVGPAGVFLVS